jgi:hypothetical protein
MIERKTVPVDDAHTIGVVTEQMADGNWAFVASITHQSPTGEKIIDLPIRDARYPSQAEAEKAGVTEARDWITHNMPHAA